MATTHLPASSHVNPGDAALIAGLRRRDEAAFARLIDQYHGPLIRLALAFVSNREAAEDVVQETWMAVLQGIDGFEGRSSLRTWLFRILSNRAKTRGAKDSRVVPFSSFASAELEHDEPAVDADRFRPPGEPWAGHWLSQPQSWDELPEERLMSIETMAVVQAAIDALPPAQRSTIVMRDVNLMTSEETCAALAVTEANQRVLLHRARSKVRRALEVYLGGQ
ncbi:MAG: RNA polymerase sigma factor [Dehalococcoidia bacterium]